MTRWFPPATLFFLAIWAILLVGGRERFLRDPGTFWHTTVGETIIERGALFERDPFSFTYANERWIPHQWLGEVGMAYLYRLGGLDAELIAITALLALVFAWLGWRLVRSGWHWLPAFAIIGLGLASAATHFHVRPHVVSIALMALVSALLTDFEARRIPLGWLLLLVPIFMFWANIHGGALGGLATCGLALLGWQLWHFIGRPSPLNRVWKLAAVVGIGLLSAGAMLVNPFGLDMLKTWLDIMRTGLPDLIKEHASLKLSEPSSWGYVAFSLFYLLMLIGVRGRLRVMWLVPLVWMALGFDRVRHAPLFTVSALIALADFFPFTIYAKRIQEQQSDLFMPDAMPSYFPWQGLIIPILAVGIALGTLRDWARLDPSLWPLEVHQALVAHQYDRAGGTRIFNEFLFGGYLIGQTPGYRVFIDDRCELYGDAWIRAYMAARDEDTAAAMREWQQRYGMYDMALVEPGAGYDRYFASSPEWQLVQGSATANLYRRRPS